MQNKVLPEFVLETKLIYLYQYLFDLILCQA